MGNDVLIRGVNWLGDAVMTLPAIHSIRKALPDDHLSLLVKPWVSPLFDRNPDIDDVILYENRYKGLTGKFRLASDLRKKRFKQAILLQNAFDAALVSSLAGIPNRIGYSRDLRGLLLTKPIPCDGLDRKIHHVEYYLELLRKSGLAAEHTEPWIHLDIEERLSAREKIKGLPRPVIGINPGAKYGSAKMWLPERFTEVINNVSRELGGSAVLFGGPGETEIAGRIVSGLRSGNENILDLSGKTSLRELIGLISECDALITNDSGPMHVGYAVKTPLVSIFGSTSPELTGPPENRLNRVLRKDLPCSPCFERTCNKPSIACMEAISAGEALSALKEVLPKNRAVFFDRDGTLCEDANYLNQWDKLKVFNDISNLNALIDNGFNLIGISNQSGISKGIVDKGFVTEVHLLFMENHGFRDFFHCPHLPEESCSCRKPEPGMLHKARLEHSIDLKNSFVVGDKDADMLLAKAVGATGIHVKTGQQNSSSHADFSAKDLSEVVRFILERK
jgi:heptosyltransferase-2